MGNYVTLYWGNYMKTYAKVAFFLFLALVFLGFFYLGISIALMLLSVPLFIQATLFTFRKGYFESFYKFMNPVAYNQYKQKGEDFLRDLKKKNSKTTYVISAATFFYGYIKYKTNSKTRFSVEEILLAGIIVLSITIILVSMERIILERSGSVREMSAWYFTLGTAIISLLSLLYFVGFTLYTI